MQFLTLNQDYTKFSLVRHKIKYEKKLFPYIVSDLFLKQ
jgi:hypothetical protein